MYAWIYGWMWVLQMVISLTTDLFDPLIADGSDDHRNIGSDDQSYEGPPRDCVREADGLVYRGKVQAYILAFYFY